jgi:outer membrane receptor protein involved in Fe transport
MYKRYLFLVLILVSSFNVYAGKISGKVTDAANNEPLTGVLVVVRELNKVVETDDSGKYEFTGIDKGTYEIVFNYVTYKKNLQTVTLLSKDVELNVSLKSETNTLKDVTVKANKTTNTESAVMMEIRKSNVVVSGVSATQISKTMDRNAADVVKRVPGVTVRDNKYIMVRGLSERYNNVWLNDAGAPSSDVDRKTFSFDMVPAGLIDRMLVYKTPAPELPGDFAGGMVKIYTSSIPDKNQISLSYQMSHLQNSTGTMGNYEEPSKTDKWGYDDGKRQLSANTPAYINKADSNNAEVTRMFKNDWVTKQKKVAPDGRFNLSAAGIVKLGRVRIGSTLGASYSKVDSNYTLTRQNWDSTAQVDYYNDQKTVSGISIALMNNTAVAFGNSKIEFKNLYNQSGKSTVIYRASVRDTVNLPNYPDEKGYSLGYDSRACYTSQLSGTHKTTNDKTKYNWTLGYTDLFKNQPDLRRIKYAKQQTDDDSMYKAAVANIVDPVNGGGRFYAQLFEHVYSFSHQITQTITVRKYTFDVTAGNYIEYKDRYYWARNLGYTIAPGLNAFNLTRLPIDQIFSDSNVAETGKFKIDEITDKSYSYTAQNKLIASFLAVKLPVGKKFSLYTGVRYEQNTQSLQSFISEDSIGIDIKTNFWLPSLNATYNITDKTLVRAAYGKSLNRPEFREWSPFYFYDFEERAGTRGSLFPNVIYVKGDTLDVAQIQNFDARWEWYPSTNEMVHAGVFYKSFKDPIQRVILPSGGSGREYSFINTEKAYSMGIEVEARKSFNFLDEWLNTRLFSGFSFVGNAAFIKSEQTINVDTTNQIGKAQLQGQSPYMYNAGLFYQNDSLGFQGSVLYNVFGPRMYALGSLQEESVGELPFHSLDITLAKYFYKHFMLNIGVQNLLDQTARMVLDVNRNDKFEKPAVTENTAATGLTGDRLYQSYKPGRYFTVGVKVKF